MNPLTLDPVIHSFGYRKSLRRYIQCHIHDRYPRVALAKTWDYDSFRGEAHKREDKGENDGDLGGWLCDTRATPANGRAEPGRQTIDICVQNGRQERHPPHSMSPFAPFHVYRPPPVPEPFLSATGLTPVELSTSLSRMPPKLFNFGTQPLTANQPILSLSSARVFALSPSLVWSLLNSSPFTHLSSSLLLYLSLVFVYIFHFSRCFSSFFLGYLFCSPSVNGLTALTLKNDALADR